ncbi:GM19388 [Drosophila sechellia]|uniref:GD17925 n=2 Tax=melanogaster subgroup TaxID=32351 RepID=B4QR80_DROSI|nr:GM19388 [Drosophila sechellia]EDX10210.1 GD17925 [Drosophila simulans]
MQLIKSIEIETALTTANLIV